VVDTHPDINQTANTDALKIP